MEFNVPQRIICLTEESVETLYALGKQHLIVGVSSYVKRPLEAQKLEKISMFQTSNYKKINALKPDLIIGYSDIQKDIARDLIEMGHNVYISNHRSLRGILNYIYQLSLLVDAKSQGLEFLAKLQANISKAQAFASEIKNKPRVYFEEWDEPRISSIQYVSELIELCGGINIYGDRAQEVLAKNRIVDDLTTVKLNPSLILACWCGKKVKLESIYDRKGYTQIEAIKNKQVFELEPEIFLQPGPALVSDGIDILLEFFKSNLKNQGSKHEL